MKKLLIYIVLSIVLLAPLLSVAEEPAHDSGVSDESCRAAVADYVQVKIGERLYLRFQKDISDSILDNCKDYLKVDTACQKDCADNVISNVEVRGDEVLAKLGEMNLIINKKSDLVYFATEMIDKDWIESSFTSSLKGTINFNECETSLERELSLRGFSHRKDGFTKKQKMMMRKFKTVVGRYRDSSLMPNDTSIKAAKIMNDEVDGVVGCSVTVGFGGASGGQFEACAKTKCKVVDVVSGKRIATATDFICEKNADKTTASIASIRSSCAKTGADLGNILVKYYSRKD